MGTVKHRDVLWGHHWDRGVLWGQSGTEMCDGHLQGRNALWGPCGVFHGEDPCWGSAQPQGDTTGTQGTCGAGDTMGTHMTPQAPRGHHGHPGHTTGTLRTPWAPGGHHGHPGGTWGRGPLSEMLKKAWKINSNCSGLLKAVLNTAASSQNLEAVLVAAFISFLRF